MCLWCIKAQAEQECVRGGKVSEREREEEEEEVKDVRDAHGCSRSQY